ncbi:hypothetical protein D6D17_10408 [Aureobasidium pullulans]|nr:hypothetical protein D6D17_10408 [Aureobasidium pullulans]
MAYSQSDNEFPVQDYPISNIFAIDTPAELQEKTETLVRKELSNSVNLELFLRGALVIKHRELLRKILAPNHADALKDLLKTVRDTTSDVVTVDETRSDEFWGLMGQITDEIPMLQYNDLRALRDEGKWGFQPRALLIAVACNSIAAAVQGWDQTGTNGANLFWPDDFGISIADCGSKDALKDRECGKNSLLVGLVNAAPYIIITLFAWWISDPLNHYLGRRKTIFLGAMLSLIAPLASSVTQNWSQLLGCRLVLGVGMGLKEVTVPVFSAEIAPPEIRGALVMSWQIWTAAGILLGSCANLVALEMSQNPDLIWRYQLGSAFIPALFLLISVMNSPESPRWLVRQNRVEEAYESLIRLRGRKNKILATRDLHYLCVKITNRRDGSDSDQPYAAYQRFRRLLEKGPNRFPVLASSIVMISQQLCGSKCLGKVQ